MFYGGCRPFFPEEEVCGAQRRHSLRMVHHARLAHIVLREASFVSLSVLGAILFLNHQILYMTGEKPSSLSWLAYAASTAVIYGFVRGIFFVGGMRVPHVAEDPSVCPECGQPLADGTPLAPQPAGMRSPHAAHAARPTPTAFRVRLAQPIVSSTPSVPIPDDFVNQSLDMLLRRLTDNPPAPTFASPAPPPHDSSAGPTKPGEDP